ncbi:MAG TPA: SMP-30/gluconolactonase/LRE family protein [Myxococcaceae bacterium]|nr:SMP-30/gluconolactonase/LRE family protein [Myxococcaceae bacterium]
MRAARGVVSLVSLGLFLLSGQASAWDRGRVRTFAVLPPGSSGPEGLEIGPRGHVYVTGFGFTALGSATGEGQLTVFDERGRLLRQVGVHPSTPHLLGLAFHPHTGALLVNDFGAGQVLAVDPRTGDAQPFITLPAALPHPGGSGLNDLTFDHAGNVYVSDSAQGIVWKAPPGGGVATIWIDDPLLRTTGVPPFGANGLRFNREETALFVANTGSDTVVRIPVVGHDPGGPAKIFAQAINGADGLLIDERDDLWVVENQSDDVVVLDPTGKAIARLGDFGGAIHHGSPVGILFPASIRFSGRSLLVTNLALDLRIFNPDFVTPDSEWCAQVSRYTISKISLRGGDDDDRPSDDD